MLMPLREIYCRDRVACLFLSVALFICLLPPVSVADAHDKKTVVTLSQPSRIGDVRLAPGRYVFRLFESASNRNIVQVLTADEMTVIATIIAIPTVRFEPSADTQLRFGEAPIGQPLPIRSWFYPGDSTGVEFIDETGISEGRFISEVPALPRAATELASRTTIKNKFALIVGVSRFQDSAQDLQFASKDALDVAGALANPDIGRFPNDPTHLRVLRDEQATLLRIRNEIEDIARRSGPDDLVFLYFSTHGTPSGNLATFDTVSATSGLPLAELFQTVQTRFNGARIVVVVDACFSGAPRRSDGAKALRLTVPGFSIRAFPQPFGIAFLASSKASEESFESQTLGNSVFTYYFLRALRSGLGLYTVQQLFDDVAERVPAAVWAERLKDQHPYLFGDLGAKNLQIGVPEQ